MNIPFSVVKIIVKKHLTKKQKVIWLWLKGSATYADTSTLARLCRDEEIARRYAYDVARNLYLAGLVTDKDMKRRNTSMHKNWQEYSMNERELSGARKLIKLVKKYTRKHERGLL